MPKAGGRMAKTGGGFGSYVTFAPTPVKDRNGNEILYSSLTQVRNRIYDLEQELEDIRAVIRRPSVMKPGQDPDMVRREYGRRERILVTEIVRLNKLEREHSAPTAPSEFQP